MRHYKYSLLLLGFLMVILAGCSFLGTVFKTGVGVGIFIVVALIVIIFLISRTGRRRNSV